VNRAELVCARLREARELMAGTCAWPYLRGRVRQVVTGSTGPRRLGMGVTLFAHIPTTSRPSFTKCASISDHTMANSGRSITGCRCRSGKFTGRIAGVIGSRDLRAISLLLLKAVNKFELGVRVGTSKPAPWKSKRRHPKRKGQDGRGARRRQPWSGRYRHDNGSR